MRVMGEQGRDWRRILSLFGAIFLGAILIIAALGKVVDPVLFVEQIRSEGLEGILSANSIALIALALEMGLGLALLLGVRSLWVLLPTSAMVAFFIFLTGKTYYFVLTGQRENSYDCGCFGVFLQRTAEQAFWQDFLLLVPALILSFLSSRALFRKPVTWKLGVAALAAVGIVLYTVLVPGLPPAGTVAEGLDSGKENSFQLSHQFQVVIDGQVDETAEVWESQASSRVLVISSQLSPPLILDVLSSSVYRVDSSVLQQLDNETLELYTSKEAEKVGEFSMGASGISFKFEDKKIELRPQ